MNRYTFYAHVTWAISITSWVFVITATVYAAWKKRWNR